MAQGGSIESRLAAMTAAPDFNCQPPRRLSHTVQVAIMYLATYLLNPSSCKLFACAYAAPCLLST